MSISSATCITLFRAIIEQYHTIGTLEPDYKTACSKLALPNNLLSKKCWIDSIQWHLEDEVRSPSISAKQGWAIKKKIDRYNQDRTDTVEALDLWLFDIFSPIESEPNATINSETPGWILDRLSILCLKIYHMNEQTKRLDASPNHLEACEIKLSILKEQQIDLGVAFDQLLLDIGNGSKKMKRYLQMKMYNDAQLNPILYTSKNKKTN